MSFFVHICGKEMKEKDIARAHTHAHTSLYIYITADLRQSTRPFEVCLCTIWLRGSLWITTRQSLAIIVTTIGRQLTVGRRDCDFDLELCSRISRWKVNNVGVCKGGRAKHPSQINEQQISASSIIQYELLGGKVKFTYFKPVRAHGKFEPENTYSKTLVNNDNCFASSNLATRLFRAQPLVCNGNTHIFQRTFSIPRIRRARFFSRYQRDRKKNRIEKRTDGTMSFNGSACAENDVSVTVIHEAHAKSIHSADGLRTNEVYAVRLPYFIQLHTNG